MAKTQTTPWDPADHLESEEDMAAYLNVALEDGDLSLIIATLGDIARAKRMTVVAQETGLGRESLYKSLSPDGNPRIRHRPQGSPRPRPPPPSHQAHLALNHAPWPHLAQPHPQLGNPPPA